MSENKKAAMARMQLELMLIESQRDKSLTAAVANYVHSQCKENKIDAFVMLVSLMDLAAVMMASALIDTPPPGSVCKCITSLENYFHARTHEEIKIQSEARR